MFCLGQFGDEERGVLLGNPRFTEAREVAKDAWPTMADRLQVPWLKAAAAAEIAAVVSVSQLVP